MILRVVGKPSPLPAVRVEKKASKIRDRSSSLIPTPVSITSSTTQGPCLLVVRINSPPDGIACSAFKTRFSAACLNSSPSSRHSGRSRANRVRITMPLVAGVRFVEIAQLVNDRVQVGRLELELLHPRKPQKALEDAVQPLDLRPQPLQPLQHAPVTRRLGVLKILQQQVEIERKGRKRIPDLVSQPSGKLRDLRVLGAQPLRRFFLGKDCTLRPRRTTDSRRRSAPSARSTRCRPRPAREAPAGSRPGSSIQRWSMD